LAGVHARSSQGRKQDADEYRDDADDDEKFNKRESMARRRSESNGWNVHLSSFRSHRKLIDMRVISLSFWPVRL
jgi:hypothetical protein